MNVHRELRETSFMPRRFCLLLVTLLAATALAGDLTVERDHRWVWPGPDFPPDDFTEGTVMVTISGVAPLDVLETVPDLRRLDEGSFSYVISWHDTATVAMTFVDGDGVEHALDLAPNPPAPDPTPHTVAVLNVTCAPAALWDPVEGIYCWGESFPPNFEGRGELWEREAIFQYTDPDNQLLHQRPIGLRIHGESSRRYPNKPLRFYFDHHGIPETIQGDFFGHGLGEHARLTVRSADAPDQYWADPVATGLFGDLGHRVSRWAPSVVYLNNEYWGLYQLRERLDDEWAEVTLGLSGAYDLIKDGEAQHGSIDDLSDFLDAVEVWADPEEHAFTELVTSRIDLGSYLDWVLINIMLTTADNGGLRNLVLLRPEGGIWEFVMWDEDLVLRFGNREHDFFTFFTSTTEAAFDANRPTDFYIPWNPSLQRMFILFDKVTRNPVLRRRTMERWQELRTGPMSGAALTARFDAVVGSMMGEAERHMDRWQWPGTHDFELRYGEMGWILGRRDAVCDDHAAAFFAARMLPVELTEWSATRDDATVTLAWRTEQETDTDHWRISRAAHPDGPYVTALDGIPAAGTVAEPTTYAVDDPAPLATEAWYRLTHVLTGGQEVTHPWTVWEPGPPPTVVLNEFMASNDTTIADETGAYEDWVELYNPGEAPVDLSGYGLTDDLTQPDKWILPPGTSIAGLGYLIVWCDDDPGDGPLHATFKLSADGEELGLARPIEGGYELIDSHPFDAQVTDVSEGRSSDGAATWVAFTSPTPGAANGTMSAVASARSAGGAVRIWPNPTNPGTTISYALTTAGPATVRLYDLAGRHVRTLASGDHTPGRHTVHWDGRGAGGAPVAAGVYHVVVAHDGSHGVARVTVVK
jgi:hypothetical protein